MRFFKENSDSIIKLLINQVGVAIFAFFLYTAASVITDGSNASLGIKIGISVFSVLFYFVLIYNIAWEIGAKDKIRIDAKRMENKPLKGLGLGLFANLTNYIVIGISLILFVVHLCGGPDAFYKIFTFLNAIFRIFVSMYLGIIQGICSPFANDLNLYYLWQTILFFVFSIISALFIFGSYLIGLKDFRIFKSNSQSKNN